MATPHHGGYALYVLPGLVISGIGQGLNFPSMTSAALAGVQPERHAVAGAVNVVAQQIGASVGVAVMVLVAATSDDRLTGYHLAYLVAGIACALGAVSIAVVRRAPGVEQSPETPTSATRSPATRSPETQTVMTAQPED
ncbi:MFS transporter [Streptomyces sp. NPDC048669]|uniref:MFS transporter n=1 Tax=Streptomyces sp. NPDC048669 TaxID=3155267 RepID=UPI0034215FEF